MPPPFVDVILDMSGSVLPERGKKFSAHFVPDGQLEMGQKSYRQ